MISVIIVNYNGEEFIRRALRCLIHQTAQNLEIIVVDNASRDNSVALIQQEFPQVNLIIHSINSGFAGGNIIGLKVAKGDYIALLNSDAFPESRWLALLLEGLNSDPKVGICASKLVIDGTSLIDSAGDGCTTEFKGYKRGEMQFSSLWNKQEYVFGACGGAVLYRRAMLDEIGFLDEDFFLIHEDTDLNFRAQLAGWKCLYVPEAIVHHQVRSTIGQNSDVAIYYSNRNTDFVWLKNTPFLLMIRYLHHKIISDLGSFIYFGFRKKRLRLFLRAKLDVLRSLPSLLKKRRSVQALKKISDKELVAMLTPIWSKGYFRERLKKLRKG